MAYNLPNFTNASGGMEEILFYEATQVSGLMAGLLLLIYMAIVGAGYFAQERRTGAGNLPMWLSIAGLITTTAAFILFLYDNLINIEVVIICMLITIVSAFFFLIAERD